MPRPDPLDRLLSRLVPIEGGCWIWTGCRNRTGYGLIGFKGRTTTPHRMAYQLFIGPVPDGLQLDHLCRVRLCANPTHLEPVTCRTNLLRGNTLTALRAAVTECSQGHPYTPENTYRKPNGCRMCRQCHLDRDRRRMADPVIRAAKLARNRAWWAKQRSLR